MSGMRRSMITTSGRRRSVSATADAPSVASPITRMRGERDSARRSPSRTTSWSSAMRQVISSATGRFYGAHRQAPSFARPATHACETASVRCARVAASTRRVRAPARARHAAGRVAARRTGSSIGRVVAARQVRARARRAPRSGRPPRASRGRAPRGSARARPAAGGRRSPRSSARRPRARRARPPRAARLVGEAGEDRRDADADVDPRVGERRTASSRLAGGAVPGSVVRQTRSSSVGRERKTSAPARCTTRPGGRRCRARRAARA